MKKLFFCFIVFLFSISVFPGAKNYSLVALNPTCGNSVVVEVWVDNADDLLAVQWRINFDNTAYSYSSYELGPILSGWMAAINPQPNYVNFAAISAFPIPFGAGTQLLAKFTFNTLSTVCDGTGTVFQLRNVLWSSSTETDVSGNNYNLNLTVSCPPNPPISVPANPSPSDGSTNQPLSLTLNWDDSSGANSYDVYFGTTSPPPYLGTTNLSQYDVSGLSSNTQYFWYVVASNTGNSCPSQTGPIWNFTTQTVCMPIAYGFDLNNDKLVWFDLSTPGTLNVIGSISGLDQPFAADFIGNDYSKIYAIDMGTNAFVTYSTADASKTSLGTSTPNASAPYWTGMAEVGGTVYAISTNCSDTSYLYTINPTNGTPTVIGSNAISCPINLGGTPTGDLYTLDIITDNIYKINPTNASATLVGNVGFDAKYAQGMEFDIDNCTMYLAAYNNTTSQGELRTLNLLTGSSTLIGTFQGGAEIDGLSIVSCVGPQPPSSFSLLSPSNGSTNIPFTNILLDWSDSTNADYYNLYFGSTSPPPLYQTGITTSQYTIAGPLGSLTTYYWYVEAVNGCGVVQSSEWSFTTQGGGTVDLSYDHSTFIDSCATGGAGDADGSIDPGEDVYLTIYLTNSGTVSASGVSATISSTSPYVTISTATANFPDVPPGVPTPSSTPFVFFVDYNTPCGTTLDFSITINSNQGSFSDTFQLFVGSTFVQIFSEKFDSVTPPNLPPNWTSVAVVNPSSAWRTNPGTVHPSGISPHSSPNLVYFNSWTVNSGSEARLQYNVPFDFTNYSSLSLSFWMYHDTGYPTSLDRVILQVSTDGGANWVYVGAPVYRYDGTSQWTKHTIDLSAYDGQPNVMIGFSGISEWGNDCHIDDIEITGFGGSPHCTNCIPPSPNLSIQTTSFVDECPSGGAGDLDGIAQPGELLYITPIIQNTGTMNATGVSASLSTTNPSVTILVGNSPYGDIPIGGSSGPSQVFQVYISETATCPQTIDFTLQITSNEGSWTDNFQINIGGGSSSLILSEDFEVWPPAGWTIVDEQPGWSCSVWDSTAHWGAPNNTGGAGEAADADSDKCVGGMDTSLITPSINLTGALSASLEYKCNFQDYAGEGDAWTDISTDGGLTWTNLRYETVDDPSNGHTVSIDLTPYVGNTVQIRFHFYAPSWDWYWRVDEVRVYASLVSCITCTCPQPLPFNLITPPNGAVNQPINGLLLDWEDSTNATSYDLYFGTTSPPPLYQSNLPTSDFTVNGLTTNTTYHWYVVAKNYCASIQSVEWSFTTICPVPSAFNLISPPNGATGVSLSNVLLDWQDSTNATSYNLYFGTNPTPPLYQSNILSSQYTIPSLSPSTTYYWRVEAVNSCGTTSSSTWSFTTTTGCTPPPTPTLISPPNGSTDIVPPVELKWSGSGADFYEVYLGTRVGYLDLIGTTTSTSYIVSNLEGGTTYYWVINAVNNCGNSFSATWSFTTAGAPPVEEYETIIPAVASAEGARSSNWKTDVQIFNPSEKTINYTMYFIPPNIDGTQTPYSFTGTIEPKKLSIFNDIVRNTFGLTQIAGGIQIASDGKLIATVRTYSQTGIGTYGQFVRGYDVGSAIGKDSGYFIRQSEVGNIFHLINTLAFRTNVGFMEVKGKEIEVLIDLYDNENNLLGSGSYNLLPKGFLQVNDIFNSLGISGFVPSARAEIKIEGDGAVFAYASVVDNYSNDAIFVPALKEEGNTQSQSIAVAVHKAGAQGTFWKSDLRIYNPRDEAQNVTVNFVENGILNTKTFEIGGKNVFYSNDAIQQLFGLSDNVGNLQIIAPQGVLATSRIYTPMGQNMTYGQFVPSTLIQTPIKAGEEQYILHLSSNEFFRTNLGLSEITGSSATVEIKLYSSDGNELGSGTFNLSPNEFKQLNRIFELFNTGNINNGYAKVKVLSGNGSVLVYGSVVDNITGDAIFVIGQ